MAEVSGHRSANKPVPGSRRVRPRREVPDEKTRHGRFARARPARGRVRVERLGRLGKLGHIERRRQSGPLDGLHPAAAGQPGSGVRVAEGPGRRLHQAAPEDPHQDGVRRQRLRAAEGDGRPAGRRAAGHLLPVRHQHAADRPGPRSGQPDQDHQAAGVRLERLHPRRAGRRDRQRQGARRPGPGGQPRGGLQQDPVRAAPPGAPGPGLDLEPAGRRREGHQRPGQEDLRPDLPRRRQRDHGLGVRGDALGGRAVTC